MNNTNPPNDPYHLASTKWMRWIVLTLLAGFFGLSAHLLLQTVLIEPSLRHFTPTTLLIASVMMGASCALLSELMRLHPEWTTLHRTSPQALRMSFFWAIATPMCFVDTTPVPIIAMAIMAVFEGAWFTVLFSFFATGAFVWLHWTNVALSQKHFSQLKHQLQAQVLLYGGILGAIVLIGGPVLPELTLQ